MEFYSVLFRVFGHLKLTSLSARPGPVEGPFFLQEGRCFDKLSTSGENPLTRNADISRRKAGLARFAMLGEFDARDRAFMDLVGPVGQTQSPLVCISLGERSEEHTSELQSLMRISYAVFCLKQKNKL